MSAIQPKDLILYAGGDAWRRFKTFTRKTTRLARSGESQAEIFTRADAATCAHYLGFDGLYHLAQAGVIRPHWVDTNADGIPDTLTYLAEPSVVNSILQSQTLATTWSQTQVTTTNAAVTGPDGLVTGCTIVPSVTNTSGHFITQAVTITANEFLAGSVFVKAGAYSGCLFRIADGPSTNGIQFAMDLLTGNITLSAQTFGTGTLGGAKVIPYPNGWYRLLLWGAIGNALASGQLFLYAYDTGAHAGTQTSFAGDGVSGIQAWGAQFERNGVSVDLPPKEYVATVAAAVTKAADACTVTLAPDAVPESVYVKFVERGAIPMAAGVPRVFEISKFGANPRFLLYQTGGKYNFGIISAAAVQYSIGAAAAPNYGDIVELVGSYDGSSLVSLTQAINGGAGVTTTAAAAVPGAPAWGLTTCGLFCAGDGSSPTPGALIRAVLAQGVHTLAEFQAVP